MKRTVAFCLILFACLNMFAQGERPKVALVLSGGGAKGAAHIGVIKVLEEYDIPVDMIVGSSIGAVIGGLYAQGYTGEQLESMMLSQNWQKLILDNDGQKDDYIFKISFGKSKDGKPLTAFSRGVVMGANVEALLEGMIPSGHDSIDFNKLPIPFACNALDLRSRQEVVFHSGDLVQAIRASMSVPMVFAPVQKDDLVLIDGGMYNNLPVDIALKMGADIVIAVKLGEKDYQKNPEIETILDVSDQWFDLYTRPRLEENIANADIFIGPSKGKYNTMSYSREAVIGLIKMGEEETRAHRDELLQLRSKIAQQKGKSEDDKLMHNDEKVCSTLVKPTKDYSKRPSILAMGGYFDSEEIIALRTHVGLNERGAKGSKLMIDLKLAYNLRGLAAYTYAFAPFAQLSGGYSFRNSAPNIFKQEHIPSFNYVQHTFFAAYSAVLRDGVNIRAGVSYQIFSADEKFNIFDLYLDFVSDTRNEKYFPEKGFYVKARGDYYLSKYPSVSLTASVPIPVSDKFTLTPSIDHRTIFTEDPNSFLCNSFGGVQPGRYMDFQIPFTGFNHLQYAGNSLSVATLDARFNLKENHYAFVSGGYACDSQKFFDISSLRSSFGVRVGYSFLTHAGPLSLNVNWSNLTDRVGFYASFGFNL